MTETTRSTLDEILNSPDVGLPERRHLICVAGKLNADFDRVEEEIEQLLEDEVEARRAFVQRRANGDAGEKSTTRMGEKYRPSPDLAAKTEEREALRERMAKLTVELSLRGKPDHVWREWKAQHPPREGNNLDGRVGFNIDELGDVIRTTPREYVVAINDADYSDEQWAKIMDAAAAGDMWRLINVVHGMQSQVVDLPKSWKALQAMQQGDETSS